MRSAILIVAAWFVFADLGQSMIFNFSAEAAPMQPDSSTNSPAKLDCSFDVASGQYLRVKVKLINQGAVDLFVLNHLWKLNSQSSDVDDPEHVYRFVRNSELRLLWGIAPLPRLKSTLYRNTPYATAVRPRSSLEWDYSTKIPVSEYNVYFAGSHGGPFQASMVERVVVIVEVIEAKSGVLTKPSGLGSSVEVTDSDAVESRKSIVCASGAIELATLRRTDQFSRLDMPNEAPEPLHLAP
jgi:hypothetical protein